MNRRATRLGSPAWLAGAGAVLVAAGAIGLWLWPSAQAVAGVLVGVGAAAIAGATMVPSGRAGGSDESPLALAWDSDPDARWVLDGDGRLRQANAAGRMLIADDTLDRLRGALTDASAAELDRLRANGCQGVADHAEIEATGGCWWRIDARPLRGRPGWSAWTAHDMTARRELDIVQVAERATIGDYLDLLPGGFFSADGDGCLLHVNRTLAGWLGVDAGVLTAGGRRFAEFVVAGEGAPAALNADAAADPTGSEHGEVTLRAADGTTFQACLLQSGCFDANGDLIYTRSLVLRGVAWQWDADSDLARRQLRWLFADAPVGIVVLDSAGRVSDCNRAFLRAIGMHRDAVTGRRLTDRLAAEDREDVAAELSKLVLGTARAARVEGVRMPGAAAHELVVALYASRMEDAGGEVAGLVVHLLDTTEHRNLEVQFAQAQKMQAIGQLAGGIAHDFNNLLTAMLGFCDLLLARHGAGDPSFADIMQIRQNASRATNLVRQLLAFSRKQTLRPVVLDVAEALAELSHLLGRLLGETVELRLQHGAGPARVRVDPGQFDQVIINLAVNARDAMPRGGTLTITTAHEDLVEPVNRGAEAMPAGSYVVIRVADTGVGIAKEVIGHIFEPFFSTKAVGSGTGLGLSTVYGVVRQTGGFVFVDSAPGAGTTFEIFLPALDAADADDAVSDTLSTRTDDGIELHPVDGSGTILLVEDEEAVRQFAARALRNKGYEVLEAGNGEAAVGVIADAERQIDLIVSDVVMPGMDGPTFVHLVRKELDGVPVILISGYADESVAADLEGDARVHFLAKPFSLEDLTGTVRTVLAG